MGRSTGEYVSLRRPMTVVNGMPGAHWLSPGYSATSEAISVRWAALRVELNVGMGGGQPREGT